MTGLQKKLSKGEVRDVINAVTSLLPLLTASKPVVLLYTELVTGCVQQCMVMSYTTPVEALLEDCRTLLAMCAIHPSMDQSFKAKAAELQQQVSSKLVAMQDITDQSREQVGAPYA